MAQYWWDRIKSANKKRQVAGNLGQDISSLETLAPPNQMKEERSDTMQSGGSIIEFTGAGEDGIVQPSAPVEMVMTIDGPRMLHEGEAKVKLPGNRMTIVPQRVLEKMERELNIPGYRTGEADQIVLDTSEFDAMRPQTTRTPESVNVMPDMGPPPADFYESHDQYMEDISTPVTLSEEDKQIMTWKADDPARPADTHIVRYDSIGRPIYGYSEPAPSFTTIGDTHVDAPAPIPTFKAEPQEVVPPTAAVTGEKPVMPMTSVRGFEQIADFISPDSKYWGDIRAASQTQLSAQQAYDRAQLEQAIARGDISGASANAARARLLRTQEGASAAMQTKMAQDQAAQAERLAQVAVNLGINMEDAKLRWDKLYKENTKETINQAGEMYANGWRVEDINAQLGTNFQPEQLEMVKQDKMLEREAAELANESLQVSVNNARLTYGANTFNRAASLYSQGWEIEDINNELGTDFEENELAVAADEITQARQARIAEHGVSTWERALEMFRQKRSVEDINETLKTDFTEEELFNATWEPPQEINDYFADAVNVGTSLEDLMGNDNFMRSIADKYNVDMDAPDATDKLKEYAKQEWDAWRLAPEQLAAFSNNLEATLSDRYIQIYAEDATGLEHAQEDPSTIRLAELALGLEPGASSNKDKVDEYIKGKYEKLASDEIDGAVIWLKDNYSEMFDTPGSETNVRRILADANSNGSLIAKDDGTYEFTNDFVYPWYSADSFFKYTDWYGEDIKYTDDDAPEGYLSWEDYEYSNIKPEYYDSEKRKGTGDGGAITKGDVRRAWEKYLREGGDASEYLDGNKFKLDKFISENRAFSPYDTQIITPDNFGNATYFIDTYHATSETKEYKDMTTFLDDNITAASPFNQSGSVWMKNPSGDGYEDAKRSVPQNQIQFRAEGGEIETVDVNSDKFIRIYAQFSEMFGEDGKPLPMDTFIKIFDDGMGYVIDGNGIVQNFQAGTFVVAKENDPHHYKLPYKVTGLKEADAITTVHSSARDVQDANYSDTLVQNALYDINTLYSDVGVKKDDGNVSTRHDFGVTEYYVYYSDDVYKQFGVPSKGMNYDLTDKVKEEVGKLSGSWLDIDGMYYVVLEPAVTDNRVAAFQQINNNNVYVQGIRVADRDGNEYAYYPWLMSGNATKGGGEMKHINTLVKIQL